MNARFITMVTVLATAMMGSGPASGADWYVATNGSDTADGTSWVTAKATLQAGIDAASGGDTVWVGAGTYANGSTNVGGYNLPARAYVNKPIHVRSADGPDTTVISGSWTHRGLILGAGSQFSGFRLIAFAILSNQYGVAAYCEAGNVIVSNCVVASLANAPYTGNSLSAMSGGTIRNSTFVSNKHDHAIVNMSTLWNCYFFSNYSSAGASATSTSTLYNCVIANNWTYAGVAGVRNSQLFNCTVVGNQTSDDGYTGADSLSTAYNTIFWDNNGGYGYLLSSNIHCLVGGTYLNGTPFVNASTYDFHPNSTSICIGAGTNMGWMIGTGDLDGKPRVRGQVDIGAYEGCYVFVDDEGNDSADGSSWTFAKANLQAGVDAAMDGDIVAVGAGTYSNAGHAVDGLTNVVLINKPVTVLGVEGAQNTMIHAGTSYQLPMYGVRMTNGGQLAGFTITRAYYGGVVGGVISNCVITNNGNLGNGGGIAYATAYNCLVARNSADVGGGAIYSKLYNCTFGGNYGDYIAGDAYGCEAWNTVFDASVVRGSNYYCITPVVFSTSNASNYVLESCYTGNATFVDYQNLDFHLTKTSYGINVGTNMPLHTGMTDIDGTARIWGGTVDIGAYEFHNPAMVAYNDLGWASGQSAYRITTLRPDAISNRVWSLAPDYRSGMTTDTKITLEMVGCDPASVGYAEFGSLPPLNSDAARIFTNAVNLNGYQFWSTGTLQISFTGLDTSKRYSFALYGSRGDANYTDRWTDVSVSYDSVQTGATNSSSPGTIILNSTFPQHRTRLPGSLTNGEVARWDGLKASPYYTGFLGNTNGIRVSITANGTNGQSRAYLQAFVLAEEQALADFDDSGLGDTWEHAHFGAAAEPDEDTDGDGYRNVDEYVANTDPTDPGSTFAFNSASSQEGISLLSSIGRLYSWEYRTNMTSGGWMPLAGYQDIPGTGSTMELPAGELANQERFYRATVRLP